MDRSFSGFLAVLLLIITMTLGSCGPRTGSPPVLPMAFEKKDGVLSLFVDASSESAWFRVDLDNPSSASLPEEDPTWDLAFQRVDINTRTGALTGDDVWYDYDMGTHKVTPWEHPWEFTTDKGRILSLKVLNYYDASGTSGHYSLEFREQRP